MPDGYRQWLNAPLHSPRGAAFHGRAEAGLPIVMLCTTRARPRPQRLCIDSQLHRSSHRMRHKLPRKSLWQRRCSPTEESVVGTISLFRLYQKDSSQTQTGRIPGPHRPTTYKCLWRMLHMSSQTRTPTARSPLLIVNRVRWSRSGVNLHPSRYRYQRNRATRVRFPHHCVSRFVSGCNLLYHQNDPDCTRGCHPVAPHLPRQRSCGSLRTAARCLWKMIPRRYLHALP
jgi:hypothetical protein